VSLSNYATLHIGSTVFVWEWVMCLNFVFKVLCPWEGVGSTTKILPLVMARHRAQFDSSSYNGWNIEIAGSRFGGTGPRPFWVRVGLAYYETFHGLDMLLC